MTDFIQEKFPKAPTLKLQINTNNKKPQTDSNKKGSMTQRPSNLDALIDKKLAEKKASIAAASGVGKKVSLTGRK